MKTILLTLLLLVTFSVKSQDLFNLEPTGFVNDYENTFTPEQKDTLEAMLSDYEKLTSIEIFLITSADFDFDSYGDELAEKWGIGKSTLDNGVLLTHSKEQRNYSIRVGYGLTEFLIDYKTNQFSYDLETSLKNEDYFGGMKELILKIQSEIGDIGYDMLVENREIVKAKAIENTKAFFSILWKIVSLLVIFSGIGYLIHLRHKKRKDFLLLKSDISTILKNIDSLKISLNFNKELPSESVIMTDHQKMIKDMSSGKIENLTKDLIIEETKISMQSIYSNLFDYKRTINSIDASIQSLVKTKSDIEKYLRDNYFYCSSYLKNELNVFLQCINIDELKKGDFSKKRMRRLAGAECVLENKLDSFLHKVTKINSIIVDIENINSKIEDLKDRNSEYIRKKTILSSTKIGGKYKQLVNINFDTYISKIRNEIVDSFNYLEKDDLEYSLSSYGNHITTIAVLTGAFSSVDRLFDKYNKSVKYVKINKDKILNFLSDIDGKINSSGVSYSRKSKYTNIKTTITKYNSAVNTDVILASALLTTIISDLSYLLRKVKSDISSYKSRNSNNNGYGGVGTGGSV